MESDAQRLIPDAWQRLLALLERLMSDEIGVAQKASEFSAFLDQPVDEAEIARTDLVDPEFAAQMFRRMWPLDLYFRPEIRGVENLPTTGGAVLVSNHVILAIDTMVLSKLLFEQAGRLIRPTVDKAFIRLPYVRNWAQQLGCVQGLRENAVRLVGEGELVLSYPGGAREALKNTRTQSYELMWEKALGFVKVAALAGVPIVPVASVGGDDAFETLEYESGLLSRFIGKDTRYRIPFYLGLGPLPLPIKFYFAIGEPIGHGLTAEDADNEEACAAVQERVRRALESLLDETRLRRGASIFG